MKRALEAVGEVGMMGASRGKQKPEWLAEKHHGVSKQVRLNQLVHDSLRRRASTLSSLGLQIRPWSHSRTTDISLAADSEHTMISQLNNREEACVVNCLVF